MKRKADERFTVEELSRNVHRLSFTLNSVRDEAWFLLCADVHWDNPFCNRGLLTAHFNEARDRRAGIISAGDWFCAMQGKYDKRSNKDCIRPEHNEGNYLDRLVTTSADWLAQWGNLLTVFGDGNHETAIRKNHETDLLERMVQLLRGKGSRACKGGYCGFVVFQATTEKTRRTPFKLFYDHGSGGGGPVTRDVIKSNRRAAYLCDADIVLSGHTHDSWQVPIQRIRLTQKLHVEQCRQVHIKVAGYKDEFGDGYGGWHVERGGAPKPLGAAWLRFFVRRDGEVDFELTEAK